MTAKHRQAAKAHRRECARIVQKIIEHRYHPANGLPSDPQPLTLAEAKFAQQHNLFEKARE